MTGADLDLTTLAAALRVPPGASGDNLLVVLAPHYDDGVFSVGGLVHQHVRGGGRALVVTVFGGPPASEDDAASPLAQALHARWAPGVGAATPLDAARAIVALRRHEDLVAVASLGADQQVLDFPDCIYRRVGTHWRCDSEADLFRDDGPDETVLRETLTGALAPFSDAALVLAPLGLGRHVDHALTHAAARALPNVGYYEDIPYAIRPAGWAGKRVLGLEPHGWPITESDLEAKERACLAYASQWTTFWADPEALAAEVRRAARSGWSPGTMCETVWLDPESIVLESPFLPQGHPHR